MIFFYPAEPTPRVTLKAPHFPALTAATTIAGFTFYPLKPTPVPQPTPTTSTSKKSPTFSPSSLYLQAMLALEDDSDHVSNKPTTRTSPIDLELEARIEAEVTSRAHMEHQRKLAQKKASRGRRHRG